MTHFDCKDNCQKFGSEEIRIFSYLEDDYPRCVCRLCPEDYLGGDKLNLLLTLMGCGDIESLKQKWYYNERKFLAYYCKVGHLG